MIWLLAYIVGGAIWLIIALTIACVEQREPAQRRRHVIAAFVACPIWPLLVLVVVTAVLINRLRRRPHPTSEPT